MTMIGIMQGRLVPPVNNKIQAFPRENWADEFPNAAQARLDCIEWIDDTYGEDVNPIGTAQGIAQMNALSAEHGVAIRSMCADWFMDYAFVRASDVERKQRLERLDWLLGQAKQVGIERVVLPFVDQSAITNADEENEVVDALQQAVQFAERHQIELHLETSLNPAAFAGLLTRLPHPMLKVNYDSGNSSSLGYHPADEFAAYGEHIGSVHIKDRVRGGTTVPLGTGDADFPALFAALRKIDYQGDIILQVARGVAGDEVVWAQQNKAFVVGYLE